MVCGVVSALFLLLFIIKVVAFPKLLAEDMTVADQMEGLR